MSEDCKVIAKNKTICSEKENYDSEIFFNILNNFIKKKNHSNNRTIPVGMTICSIDLEYR